MVGDLHIRIAKLAFYAKESPIRTPLIQDSLNLLEKLVLGGTWRRHDDLDLSEKQLETRTEDICMI